MDETKINTNPVDVDDEDSLIGAFGAISKEEKYIDENEQVKTDIDNAISIMSYIVDRGLNITQDQLTTVIESKVKYRTKKWTQESEIKFYMTYRELTKTIKPVTVDSLTSSRPSALMQPTKFDKMIGRSSKWSLSKRTVTGYSISTLVCMMLLLLTHIYFHLGSTRLNNVTTYEAELNELLDRQGELMEVANLSSNSGSDEMFSHYQQESERMMDRINNINNMMQSNIDLLGPWTKYIRMATFNTTINTDTIAMTYADMNKANQAVIQEAKGYVYILGIYVLPLIYGIIGGFTFVLRELNNDIRRLTFSTGSSIKYLLRILLGAIAGLSIGLFWGDIQKAQELGLSSLSPMLLAFLGGYCVEYLLQFIERLPKVVLSKTLNQLAEPAKKKEEKAAPAVEEPAQETEDPEEEQQSSKEE